MDKDRQEAAQKRRAVIRLPEARPKRARGTTKAVAPGGSQPTLATKSAAPGKRVADFGTNISVDDYLIGKSLARVFF
jgi:hypothetical protein